MVTPYWEQKKPFKNILFPTDFSKESHEAYVKILDLARQRASSVTLYHRFRYDLAPALEVAMRAIDVYPFAYKEELAARRGDAEKWSAEGKRAGVRVKVVVDRNAGDSVARSIIQQAERHSGIIAMASHSGTASATLLGSSTRGVLRESHYPVWIIHPGAQTKTQIRAGGEPPLFTVTENDIEEQLFKKDLDAA